MRNHNVDSHQIHNLQAGATFETHITFFSVEKNLTYTENK